MKNDLHKTFGQIFDNDIDAFRDELIRVQAHQVNRKDAEEWVKHLRFLDISKVPDLQSEAARQRRPAHHRQGQLADAQQPCHIPVTERKHDDDKIPYVAVSWKWATKFTWDKGRRPLFHYMIKRPGAQPHKSDFPDEHMERVIMFAQSRDITKIWIDKECIYQRNDDKLTYPNDKDLGVQIMDVVYGISTASVGLLTTPLVTQEEVDLLQDLVTRRVFLIPDDTDEPILASHRVDIQKIQRLISKILGDERWSRGWIFQEDHLASATMTLLLPCDDALKVYDDAYSNHGKLSGEVQVNVKKFREAVTMFCLASKEPAKSSPTREFLGKVKQYKIWNKVVYNDKTPGRRHRPHVRLWSDEGGRDSAGFSVINTWKTYSNINIYPTMTNSILDDICSRSLANEEDRIAILANALRYSKRLDTSKTSPIIKTGQYSLSVAMLAQILVNGEILENSGYEYLPEVGIMDHTLQSYLRRYEFRFNAPNFRYEQSFINQCRFRSPVITHQGIKTKGFLYKILPLYEPGNRDTQTCTVRLSDRDRYQLRALSCDPRARYLPTGRKLNDVAHAAINIVIKKLEKFWPEGGLAEFLQEHLALDLESSGNTTLSAQYVLDMMSAVCQALRDDRELCLARLASDLKYEPNALFITPPSGGWATGYSDLTSNIYQKSGLVFVSWDGPHSDYDRERLASLEVAMFDQSGKRNLEATYRPGSFLRTYGWVNGVFDFRGAKMETYVFPLPGITDVPKTTIKDRKRKIIVDDDDSDEW
jgi:hypothetical protein